MANKNGDHLNVKEEPEYVVVAESIDGEAIELPTNVEDNTLGLTTLTHAFPGATGLKYKNPATNATRALLLDATGTKFYPPTDGWAGKLFTVICPPITTAASDNKRGSSDQNPKRKKMMDDENDSESDTEMHYGSKQKRMDAAEEEPRCVDLIVLGLPYKLTEDELKEYFEQFGKVVLSEIKRGTNGESKGFGFVQMEKYESQLRVLAKHIHTIGGRKCQVKVPLSKKPESYTQDLATIASSKLFIGRLQEKTSADALKEFFNKEAKKIDPKSSIIDVFVPKPFRSFAFITFSNPNVVQKLIRKGDFIIDGASISVSAAAPRQALTPGYSQTYGGAQYGYEKGQFQHPPASVSRSSHQQHGWNDSNYPPNYPPRYDSPFADLSRSAGYAGGYPSHGMPPGGSQAIASSLETLNLNNMKPEVMDAFKAFLSVAQSGGSSGPMPPYGNPGHQGQYGPPGNDGRNQQRPSSGRGWRGYGN
uniref:RRM domain-containing protein n=1 Tax=Acrobeloides nanus TaxID=290746 RepID=A0A914CB19_9BILA